MSASLATTVKLQAVVLGSTATTVKSCRESRIHYTVMYLG